VRQRGANLKVRATIEHMPEPQSAQSGPLYKSWADRRVLVTGGAGFIGSALIWELNRRGCSDIVIADSAPASARQYLLRPLAFSEYVDPGSVLERLHSGSLATFDCVFHLGACSSTLETDADFLFRNNFAYSRDL